MLTIERSLNVYAAGIPQIINLSQYDDDFQLMFSLYTSEGVFTVPSGTTAEIMGTKVDGNGYSADATISGNTVTVTGNNQMTACAGRNIFEIVLTKSGKRLATINFILQVERAALDADTIQSETVLKELQAIIDSAATSTQAAQDAEDAADRAEEAARTLTIDTTLTQSGQAADAKVTGDEINNLKEDLENLEPGLSDEAKAALLACFAKVAWIDEHGQNYVDALRLALYPDAMLSISTVLSLGNHQVFMNDNIDSLRNYLTVTAHYGDGTQGEITNYDLSGDISSEGTKTITVSANEKTTTFECPVVWGYRLTAASGEITVGGIVFTYRDWQDDHYFDATNTVRFSNKTFLPWDAGYDCYVEADTELDVVGSVNVVNQTAMNSVSNHSNIASANVGLPGWQSTNPGLSVIPNSINNSPTKAIRLTFKTVPTESAFSENSISEVRVTRRAK